MTAPEMGQPRPIAKQTWRRHHTGRGNYGNEVSPTSGCQRRRRKAIERRTSWTDGTYGVLVVDITPCLCKSRTLECPKHGAAA